MKKITYILTLSLFFSSLLTISSAHAQDRVALIIQQYGSNANFQNALYSGAADAAEQYDLILDVHDGRLSTKAKAIRWFKQTLLRKQPNAIIIVDVPASGGNTQAFLDEASRRKMRAAVLNADMDKLYSGADFRAGSGKANAGKVAGEYLQKFNTTPLCISYVSETSNDRLICKELANAIGKRIYELNADTDHQAMYDGVKKFLGYFPENANIIVTDQALLTPLFAVREQLKQEGGNFSIGFIGTGGSGMVKRLLKGDLAFIVNDQPYFQGYWAVSALSLAQTFKLEPQKFLASGPVVIDRQMAQKIQQGQKKLSLGLTKK